MTDTGVLAPIHKNNTTTLPRIYNFFKSTRFQETNLVGKLYPDTQPVDSLTHWALPGGEGAWQSWTFDEVIQQDFTAVTPGETFGPTWSTHWFKVDFTIPSEWAQKEVRLRWVSGTEATIWSSDGEVLQGLSTGTSYMLRTEYIITSAFDGSNATQTLYIEAVACKLFGASTTGDNIDPPSDDFSFSVITCELVTLDRQIYKITRDLEILHQVADKLIEDQRGYMAMHTANQMVNSMLEGDYAGASALADAHLAKTNGMRAHNVAAIGNCHIDTAWLWPYSETKRKVARSFSNQLRLMERAEFSDYKFVASQAQQWAWCQEYFNDLFTEVIPFVNSGQFIPVGMTWTEMDGNIPNGESFIRQFLYGNKFYVDELGFQCKEFWLPDTFGYSGQIPALMRHVNLARFLTQKLSWNTVNKFPHQNFKWEGIDGSTVIAHFPPGESYTLSMTVDEVKRTEDNLMDKGRVNTSALLYGYGDGGGGPTEDMIERAIRMADVDGIPKVKMTNPDELFQNIEADADNLMTWVGELFLEFHNGTYTSQADMKRLNRKSEFSLRDAEFMLSSAVIAGGGLAGNLLISTMALLEEAWKNVLLNQFHDVLPGTSIEIVYEDARFIYNDSITKADEVYDDSCIAIFGSGVTTTAVAMNTLQWPRREVMELTTQTIKDKKIPEKGKVQKNRATTYLLVDAPAFGYGEIVGQTPTYPATYSYDSLNDTHTISNGLVEATIESGGQLISLRDMTAVNGRDIFQRNGEQKYGNQLTLYDDEPLYWDAWDIMDYHLETPTVLNNKGSTNITSTVSVVDNEALAVVLTWSMTVGDSSTLTQNIVLKADTPYISFETMVDWSESHRVLKTGFDTNILARNASFDIQFGYIQRATHMNTSWDTARYEVCGHKWADLSEPNAGLAILNESKFGWFARGSSLYLSLLKAPKAPDENCDMATHSFTYAVMPHSGTLQEAEVMRRSYEFNNPLRVTNVDSNYFLTNSTWSMFDVQGSGVVLHTIKPADDTGSDIILRLFESNGAQSKATITIQEAAVEVNECDGFENIIQAVPFTADEASSTTTIEVSLKPFKIYALRIKFFTAKRNAITKKLKVAEKK